MDHIHLMTPSLEMHRILKFVPVFAAVLRWVTPSANIWVLNARMVYEYMSVQHAAVTPNPPSAR